MKHVIVGLLALGALAGCSDLKVPEDPKPPMPFGRIFRTPANLWQEFETQPGLTDWQKKETRVRITGNVAGVFADEQATQTIVALSSGDGKHYVFVTFPESWRPVTTKLKVKESTMIEGVFDKPVNDARTGKQALNFEGTAVFN